MLRRLAKPISPAGFRLVSRCYAVKATSGSEEADLVVIGGGPGGYVAAIKAAQEGLKTVCVEKRGSLGGTCLNVGCIPSKALLNNSHHYEDVVKNYAHHGIICKDVKLDLPTMMKQKSDAVTKLTGGIEYLFKKNKVSYEKGSGEITSPNEVTVNLSGGGSKVLKAKNIMIATGSDVMSLPFLEIDEKQVISSTGALDLKAVPKHMIVIGGGVIGLELGSVWRRLGAKVTVVEFMPAIAAGADGEVAKEFHKVLKKQGIEFMLNSKVTAAKKSAGSVKLTVEGVKTGKTQELEGDVILVSVGRKPYTQGLGLEKVGVAMDKQGRVIVDDHFTTNVPSIRAIGDVIRGPMLAHKAEDEGLACVENILNPKCGHINYDAIPSVVYTNPEVAWVGATEEQLKEKGIKYKVGKFPFVANSRAKTNDTPEGFVKFLADSTTDRILGVHIIGANAGELIAEPVLGMEYGASSEDIARTCHAHPTLSEAVKEAAMAVTSKAIHF